MAAPLALREAGPGDVPALLDMMADFNALERIPWDPARTDAALAPLLTDRALGLVLLAAAEGATLGYVVLTWGYDLEFGGRDAFLTEVYLRPEARGRGLGGPLLAAVDRAARAHGVQALHLMVLPENERALAVYERAGFAPSPRTMMTKVLS